MLFKSIIKNAELNPRKLFLLDGIGAILSAFLLGIVLVRLERYFGIPSSALYILAAIPVFFLLYDFYCYRKVNDNLGQYLKGIAVANFLYCCLSIGFAFYHFESITALGWCYILVEILIVVVIAFIEYRVANNLILQK